MRRVAPDCEITVFERNRARDAFGFLAPYGNGWYRSMTWDRRGRCTPFMP